MKMSIPILNNCSTDSHVEGICTNSENSEVIPIKKAIDSLKKFPLFPHGCKPNTPVSTVSTQKKNVKKTELTASTPVTTRHSARRENARLSLPPGTEGTSSPNSLNNDAVSSLNELVNVFKSLAIHMDKFGTILSQLETSLQSTVNHVRKLEEMTATQMRCQELEQKVEVLEGRNKHLFERINSNNSPQPVETPPANDKMYDNLQGQLNHLHQSRRCNDIILSGPLIERRITHELDREQTSVKNLCIDIVARIHGLEDCSYYIDRCRRLDDEHPKLLITLNNNHYRGKIFANFFPIKMKPFFY